MGSAKKFVGKVFGGGGGGGDDGAARRAEEEARRMREQQRIERENQLMLQGSIGSESASTGGTVESGKAMYGGEFSPRKRKRGENVSASLGIM